MLNKAEPLTFEVPSRLLKCTLTTVKQSSGQLAIVLPGAGYSARQPLLYFAIRTLLQKRFDVLSIDTVYGDDPKWCNLPTEQEARKVVEGDAVAFFNQISERFPHQLHTVVGRSLGTYFLACALERKAAQPAQIIWQTPSLGTKWEVMSNCGVRGFGILGTKDMNFEMAMKHLPKDRIVIEMADHGMEVEGDPIRSIEILKQVTQATSDWLGGEKRTDAMITRVHHAQVSIPKGSEGEARSFYCEFLGLKERDKPESLKGRGGFWLSVDELQVHFGVEDGVDRNATKSHIAYEVSGLGIWREKLRSKGIETLEGISIPGWDRFEFRDPFGNRVEFIERK